MNNLYCKGVNLFTPHDFYEINTSANANNGELNSVWPLPVLKSAGMAI